VLHLSGRASTVLAGVALANGADTLRLAPSGTTFSGRLLAEASGRWAWQAAGTAGTLPDLPQPLVLEVLADSAPRVELLAPAADSIVDGMSPVRVALSAGDDHGLAVVTLRTWRERAGARRAGSEALALARDVPAYDGEALVDLGAQPLAPGERLHVLAVATDASPWRQSAASREIVLRVPGTAELRASARAAADSAVSRASSTAAAQRDLQRRTDEAARARELASGRGQQSATAGGENKSMSYQTAERARGLAQEQRALSQKVEALRQEAKSLERQLKQAGALDQDLAQRMADVQRLLRDALTPELQKQLAALEQSASQLEGAEARQALDKLAAEQQALRERLERSVDMLKRAALEGQMATLRDEARRDAAGARARRTLEGAGRRRRRPPEASQVRACRRRRARGGRGTQARR